MKLSKLIRILQEHMRAAGDVPVGIWHDTVYGLRSINSVQCDTGEIGCFIATELGTDVLQSRVAAAKAARVLKNLERFIANAQETASHYRQLLEADGFPMDKFPDARGTRHHKLASSVIEYAIAYGMEHLKNDA